MMEKTTFATRVLIVFLALMFSACHHMAPENQIGSLIEESSERISPDAAWNTRLDAVAEELSALRKQIATDRDPLGGTTLVGTPKKSIDRPDIAGSVADKHRHRDMLTDYLP